MKREHRHQVLTELRAHYLLLFHKLRVWHIVDDILSENWGRQDRVYLLGIEVVNLSIQYELIAFGSEIDSHFPAQEYECIDIAILVMRVSISLSESCRMASQAAIYPPFSGSQRRT